MQTQPTVWQPQASKDKFLARSNYHQALRKCEETCARIQKASQELVTSWTGLGNDLATGASATEVLRRRAWYNVFELRLKEQAELLAPARISIDAVWNEVMLYVRGRDLGFPLNGKHALENIFAKNWKLLLQPKSTPISSPKTLAATK